MPFNAKCPGCGSIDPCGCGSTKTTSSSDVKYIGPNLPGTGIQSCDDLTTVIQKIDAEIAALKEAVFPTPSTTSTTTTAAP